MPKGKTIHQREYPIFLELLGAMRQQAGLTQVQLAEKAGISQPYVSAVERGVLRLDTLQLRSWLAACGTNLGDFGNALEIQLAKLEEKASKPSKTIAKRGR